jgi:hypothetical protein
LFLNRVGHKMLVNTNNSFRICLVASYFTSALEVAVKERCLRKGIVIFIFKIYRFSVGGVYNFSLFPPPLCVVFSYCLTLKVFDPIDAKSEDMVFSRNHGQNTHQGSNSYCDNLRWVKYVIFGFYGTCRNSYVFFE